MLAIFCDGQLMASVPLVGALVPNAEPLLLGAEMNDGKPARHIHGEVDEVAIWARALSDEEITALGPPPGRVSKLP
jgi:hypothetical protein